MNSKQDAQKLDAPQRMTEQERVRYAAMVGPALRESGRTQEQVAKAASVSRNTLSDMIKGNTIPQKSALWRVLLELNIAPNNAMDDSSLSEWRSILVPLLASIPEAHRQEAVLGMVRAGIAVLHSRSADDGESHGA